jgi:hypothetical protein
MSSYLLFPPPPTQSFLPSHYQCIGSLILHPTASRGYSVYLNKQDNQYYYGNGEEKVENLFPFVWDTLLGTWGDGGFLTRTTSIKGIKFYFLPIK